MAFLGHRRMDIEDHRARRMQTVAKAVVIPVADVPDRDARVIQPHAGLVPALALRQPLARGAVLGLPAIAIQPGRQRPHGGNAHGRPNPAVVQQPLLRRAGQKTAMKIIQIVRLLERQPVALGQVLARRAIHGIEPVPLRAMNQHIAALVLDKCDGKRHGPGVVVAPKKLHDALARTQIHQHAKCASIICNHRIVATERAMHLEAMRPVRRRRCRLWQIQLRQLLAPAAWQLQRMQAAVLGQQQQLAPASLRSAGVDDVRALPVDAACAHVSALIQLGQSLGRAHIDPATGVERGPHAAVLHGAAQQRGQRGT